MRSKSYLLGFICIVATSLLLILFGDQRPAVQSILTETHKQLKNNIQTFKVSRLARLSHLFIMFNCNALCYKFTVKFTRNALRHHANREYTYRNIIG